MERSGDEESKQVAHEYRRGAAVLAASVLLLSACGHRGLGQIEILADLPDRAVPALTQLDDLGLELSRERPPRPRPLLSTFSMMMDILPETQVP